VADALLFSRLAAMFNVGAQELTPAGLALRAAVNAILGVALFTLLDRQRVPKRT
jgi:hypothetical protein